MRSNLQRILFVPDCHHPYVDRKAWSLVLRAIRTFRPNSLVVLGDFGDFYCTSRHPKNPTRTRDLKVEVAACNKALTELDAVCKEIKCADKRFLEGNHENNLERYLTERAPELFNLVRVQDLFYLSARRWRFTPYKHFDRIGKLIMTHEVGYAGRDAHIRSQVDTNSNIIIGHTHRLAAGYSSDLLGKHRVGLMAGWLGDKVAAEYMYRSKTKDWQLGFAIGYREPNSNVHVFPVPILDGYKCIVEGRLVT